MHISTLKEHQLELLLLHSSFEGWDIEKAHIIALFKTYNDDFFIAYKEQQLLGFIVALKKSPLFGFISTFLVLKEFRGLGYGKKLFEHALKHLKGCQIALDSLEDKTTFYEKKGFQRYFDVLTYKFITGSVSLNKHNYRFVKSAKTSSTKSTDEYLKNLLLDKDVNYQEIQGSEEKNSYAFTFPYKDGYKISIESSDINEAIALFFNLCDTHPKGTSIYMQVSKLSPLLEALVDALKMTETSKNIRMYNKIL